MILLIDNYDSFTYNLYQYIGEITTNILVYRNDKITIEQVKNLSPEKIILSPGPGRPEDSGITIDIIKNFNGKIPILGICLGHQAIALTLGGEIISAPKILHGKQSTIKHNNKGIFYNIPQNFKVVRYHSLCVNRRNLPNELEVQATSCDDKTIMAFSHKEYPTIGLQFHPESILSEFGKILLNNFFKQ